jgi:hypothetical protein
MMGVMKDLHYELSQFITDEKDQDLVLELFWELKDGGSNSESRKQSAIKIVDLRSIYGEDLDHAINLLLDYKDNR